MRGDLTAFLHLVQLLEIDNPTKDVIASNASKYVEMFEKWQTNPLATASSMIQCVNSSLIWELQILTRMVLILSLLTG